MSAWSSASIQVNDISIHYTRTGGDGPPLILAHGVTDSGLVWTPIARLLEDKYDILMVDARGHGHSDKPEHGYAASDHAADLAGLIDALGFERPALIGHSMGARSVSALAAEYPERVGRIVLEDPPWRDVSQVATAAPNRIADLIARYQTMTVEEIVAYGREINPTWDEEEFEYWSQSKKLVSPNVMTRPPELGDWREIVARIQCPTLLVVGDADAGAIVTDATAEEVTRINPRIQVVHVAGAGHNIRRENHKAFMNAINAFLGGE